jgi:hypothetical protein
LAVLGVAALVTLTAVAVQTVAADADGCSTGGITLTVAAEPALAPALGEIATQWSNSKPQVNGKCIRVDVAAKPAADVANSLGTRAAGPIDVAADPAPTPQESDIPVVWVPDSTFWLARVRGVDRDAFEQEAPSLAASPVVLGVPEAATAALGVNPPVTAAAVKQLLVGRKLKFGVAEPRRDTPSLVGAMLLRDALVSSDKDLPTLVGAFRSIGGPLPDTATLLKAFQQGLNAAPLSEQAVTAHNSAGASPAIAAVPLQSAPALDFPYAILTGKPREVNAAAVKFRAALTSGAYVDILAKHGFRAPDGSTGQGFPAGHGVTAEKVRPSPIGDPTRGAAALAVWVAAKTPSRVLALVDVTSSMGGTMAGPSGKSEVRLDVLRRASIRGLDLFTNDSLLGMWAYAAGLNGPKDYLPVVPVGKLDKAQRDRITVAVTHAQPVPTNVCALFDTLLDAYKAMKDGYDRRLSNTIVVFTDGRSDKPGGMDIRQVQRELEKQSDITKPIRVILLGIGPEVDLAQLNAIAETVGGAAFQVRDPAQINTIFLKALLY